MSPRTRLRWRAAFAGLLVLTAAGSAPAWAKKAPEPEPFQVPADSLSGRVRTVAVLETVAPRDLEGAARAGIAFGHSISERLVAAGFAVVPAESVAVLWREAEQTVGGSFDPRTGRRHPERHGNLLRLFAGALRKRYHADVWLRPSLLMVSAQFEDGEARWDGVSRKVGGDGVLNVLLLGVPEGKVPAVSLGLEIEDLSARALYRRRAGLKPLSRIVKNRWEDVPPADCFTDEAVNTAALDRALGPWLERVRPGE